jgi:hypothetical protein
MPRPIHQVQAPAFTLSFPLKNRQPYMLQSRGESGLDTGQRESLYYWIDRVNTGSCQAHLPVPRVGGAWRLLCTAAEVGHHSPALAEAYPVTVGSNMSPLGIFDNPQRGRPMEPQESDIRHDDHLLSRPPCVPPDWEIHVRRALDARELGRRLRVGQPVAIRIPGIRLSSNKIRGLGEHL